MKRTIPVETNQRLVAKHYNLVSSSPFAGARHSSVCSLSFGPSPALQSTSHLISTEDFSRLAKHMPPRCSLMGWVLLYSTLEHGVSLSTFLRKTRNHKPTLLVIEDSNKHVFGAFCTGEWKSGEYTGTGESFVFTLSPVFAVFAWSGMNDLNMYLGGDYLGIGGGGNVGLYLGADFEFGSSRRCETFLNDCLASEEDFTIVVVEVWGPEK